MKKIFTLLFCIGASATLFAQTNSEQSRDIILGREPRQTDSRTSKDVILGKKNRSVRNNEQTTSTSTSTRRQIDAVNREYEAKIQSIRNNRYLSAAEKDRAIRQLENDRNKRIRELKGTNTNRRYNDRTPNNKSNKVKKNKGNNGNHYGWEKGKGNPHKTGIKMKNKKTR